MSYQIGQLRRNQIEVYTTPIAENDYEILGSAIRVKNKLTKDASYHLQYTISANKGLVKIVLHNQDNTQRMVIKTVLVPSQMTIVGELIFTPNDVVYDYIEFESAAISKATLYSMTDVIANYIKPKYGTNVIKKIGIQGPSGLMFMLNGEEMHLGFSGIYELEDLDITQLGFVIPKEEELEYFIMDFYY